MDNSPKSLIAVLALSFVIAAVPLTMALGRLGILMAGVLVLIRLSFSDASGVRMFSGRMRQIARIACVVLMVIVASPVSAQERGDLYRCSSFVEDWTDTERGAFAAGLMQGFASAVAYSDRVYNEADGEFFDEWEKFLVESDSLHTESFIVGMAAMKESVSELLEPAHERPERELHDRLKVLCQRQENRDEYVANLMYEALLEMDR